MCNKCETYKWIHSEYNYCPTCGHRLKSTVFIPGCRLDASQYQNKPNKKIEFVETD